MLVLLVARGRLVFSHTWGANCLARQITLFIHLLSLILVSVRYYGVACLIFNRLALGVDAVEGNRLFEIIKHVALCYLCSTPLTVFEVVWSLDRYGLS